MLQAKPAKSFFKRLRQGLYLSILLVLMLFGWSMWQVKKGAQQNSTQNADAAIILGAAAWGDNPSPVFKERLNHGIDLYRQGRVKMLVMTGGTPKAGFPTEAEVGRNFAVKKGVSPSDIIIESDSRNTYENLLFAKKETKAMGLEHFLIVSDPYHMYRAMLIANDLNMKVYPSPTPTSRYNQFNNRYRFWLSESGLTLGYFLLGVRQSKHQLPV